jgi:hypothetical protein
LPLAGKWLWKTDTAQWVEYDQNLSKKLEEAYSKKYEFFFSTLE